MNWDRCVDLSVLLSNEPGALVELLITAREAGVPVAGACGFLWGDYPMIHVLVGSPGSRDVFENAGFDVRAESEVLVVTGLSSPPDVLARVTGLLATAGVDVDICYFANDGGVVLGVDDFHKAETVLGITAPDKIEQED